MTVVAVEFGVLLGGAVVTETVFAWPGVGRLAVQAILTRDFPLVQAIVFVVATTLVLLNLAVDLLYGVLDPGSAMADAAPRPRVPGAAEWALGRARWRPRRALVFGAVVLWPERLAPTDPGGPDHHGPPSAAGARP